MTRRGKEQCLFLRRGGFKKEREEYTGRGGNIKAKMSGPECVRETGRFPQKRRVGRV